MTRKWWFAAIGAVVVWIAISIWLRRRKTPAPALAMLAPVIKFPSTGEGPPPPDRSLVLAALGLAPATKCPPGKRLRYAGTRSERCE